MLSVVGLKRRVPFVSAIISRRDLQDLVTGSGLFSEDFFYSLIGKQWKTATCPANHEFQINGGTCFFCINRTQIVTRSLTEFFQLWNSKVIICCRYGLPTGCPRTLPRHGGSVDLITDFKLKKKAIKCQALILTGDTNFAKTIWGARTSTNTAEEQTRRQLLKYIVEQFLDWSLDLLLFNKTEVVMNAEKKWASVQRLSFQSHTLLYHLAYNASIDLIVQHNPTIEWIENTWASRQACWIKLNENFFWRAFPVTLLT